MIGDTRYGNILDGELFGRDYLLWENIQNGNLQVTYIART